MENTDLVNMFKIPMPISTCQGCGAILGDKDEDSAIHKGRILCPVCYSEALRNDKAEKGKLTLETAISSIPPRFRDCTFKTYDLEKGCLSKEKLELMRSAVKSGKNIIMFGDNGTGKTHLLYSIVKLAEYLGMTTKVIIAADYHEEIKEAWRLKQDANQVIKKYAEPDYLLIDELDKGYHSDSEEYQRYKLLNERYLEMKGTAVTLNGNKDNIESIIGRSGFERLLQNGEVFEFRGKSFRR